MQNRLVALYISILLMLVSGLSFSDQIRGEVTRELGLKVEQGFELGFELRAEEIAVIKLGQSARFLTGLNIEIIIPDALKRYSDSFGFAVYHNIEPEPRKGMRAFVGEQTLFSTLPHSNKAVIKIPLETEQIPTAAAKPGAIVAATPLKLSAFPLVLTIQPIMKGIPDSMFSRKFFITVKQELAKRGLLDLRIVKPEGFEDVEIAAILDDQEISLSEMPLELDSGLHKLLVNSDSFKPATTSFALNPGQISSLELILEPNISTLSIESLEGASVFLDGRKLSRNESGRIQLTEGVHNIKFKLGDYSVSKKFTVVDGKNYSISLLFDIALSEE